DKSPGQTTGAFLRVSEVIVHAEAQEARVQSVVHAGDRVGAACEIHVKVLNLRRPILRKSVLQAGAGGPADKRLVLIEPQELAFELAIGKADRSVQQHIVDRKTGASAKGAEPGIRKFVRSERIVGAADLYVRFETEHKLTHLPVVTDLTSASDAARLSDVVCN